MSAPHRSTSPSGALPDPWRAALRALAWAGDLYCRGLQWSAVGEPDAAHTRAGDRGTHTMVDQVYRRLCSRYLRGPRGTRRAGGSLCGATTTSARRQRSGKNDELDRGPQKGRPGHTDMECTAAPGRHLSCNPPVWAPWRRGDQHAPDRTPSRASSDQYGSK